MPKGDEQLHAESGVPIIDLSLAPGEREAWDRPKWVVYLWGIVELVLVTNAWQISSSLRIGALRAFGAQIGSGVVFRPRTRVRFPWKLQVGDRSWIGEGVWIHNQNNVILGHDVVVSQETIITTGSHSLRRDMALITSPITIDDGAWVTARCVLLGGSRIGKSAIITPNSVVGPMQNIPANAQATGNPATLVGNRFVLDNDE